MHIILYNIKYVEREAIVGKLTTSKSRVRHGCSLYYSLNFSIGLRCLNKESKNRNTTIRIFSDVFN